MSRKRTSKSKSTATSSTGGGTLADKGLPIESVSEAADGALGAGGKRGVTYSDSPEKPDPSSVAQIEEVEAPVGA